MKIIWKPEYGRVTVCREEGDKKVYKDSTWWYNLVQALRKEGHDVIRKNPAKETKFLHLTNMSFYIRSRKPLKGKDSFWLYYRQYAIDDPFREYNNRGEVDLGLEYKIFDVEIKEKS